MIVVTGRIHTDAETLPLLFARLKEMCGPSREEDGCIFYNMGIEDEAEGIIMAMEGWRDVDALHAHLALPDVAKLLSDFEGKFRNEVSIHTVSETQSLAV